MLIATWELTLHLSFQFIGIQISFWHLFKNIKCLGNQARPYDNFMFVSNAQLVQVHIAYKYIFY